MKYKKCWGKPSCAQNRPKKAPARNVKSAEEIEGMRVACRFNAQLMQWIKTQVEIGMPTARIDELVHQYTLDHGHTPAPLNYHGFPKSLCTSRNQVVCHGIPSETEFVEDGDIINLDVTTIVDGFHGDQSETLLIGDVAPEAKRLVEVTKRSLDIGIGEVKPGVSLNVVCGAIQDYVESQGFSVVRDYTGHGIGRDFHEDPQVTHHRTRHAARWMLAPGQTFTIEPMVNAGAHDTKLLNDSWTAVTADGSLSAQFEHTVLVTDTGVEVLTDTALL
jgi:methionyl aminopeptidase